MGRRIANKNLTAAALAAALSLIVSGCSAWSPIPTYESDSVSGGIPALEHSIMESSQGVSENETWLSEETDPDTQSQGEEEDGKVTLMIATDMHYLARTLTDGGQAFQDKVDYGDGKVITYIPQIMSALVETAIQQKPDALILSGDLTLEGEYLSHQELAGILSAIEQNGIPVLVIPGNHDINNTLAVGYTGNDYYPASPASVQDFRSIYSDYGFEEALYTDNTSLSYIYELNDTTWIMMLDSCQYKPYAQVGGMIGTDTYDWIEDKLEEAWFQGIRVIPVSHHNLLDQSEIYVDDCTIEHSESLIDLMEGWDVPVYLSGHLHVQHYKHSADQGESGLYEIVTGSLATPPCLYGILEIENSNGMPFGFQYQAQSLDMESWAKRNFDTTPDLREFKDFCAPFLRRVFYNQADRALRELGLPDGKIKKMAEYYAILNQYYYQGKGVEIAANEKRKPEYGMWEGDAYGSVLADYVEYIIRDSTRDYSFLTVPEIY